MLRDESYLLDVLESSRIACQHISDRTWEEFTQDLQCQDAVIWRLEIIGEAANRVSLNVQIQLAELPWRAMIGMRNMMIHQYDAVDLKIVWETVRNDLPAIITQLESIIGSER